ncbi:MULTISPECIES: protein kinase domain-containing protein [Streptosporangium]|uniref:Protein kinase domain-containing protein n=1 Tax=Streptosporangium jomthongense TaxID=1193683 RepID=A0ABV8F5D7_9ACTN
MTDVSPDPGLLAGRYRLLERRDHTGTSWRARDELLGREVTIAEVRLPPPGPVRDRLLAQIRAAADLRHPGVTTLHDVISAPDRMWLVAEAVTGRSLVQIVRHEGPLPPERAAEVGLRVLDALNAAHERGVNLAATPDTVVLAADGRVVLTGILNPSGADEMRDLGTTLFTAMEGRAPSTGSVTVPRMADGSPLAAPSDLTGGVTTGSGVLAPIVEGLLAADPSQRPDATSVRLALEQVSPKPARSPLRSPLVIAAVAAVVLAVAGGVVWGLTRSSAPVVEVAPYVDPGPFAGKPAAKGLFTAEQLGQLGVRTDPTGPDDHLIWGTANDNDPGNLKRQLAVEEKLYPSAAEASEALARRVATAAKKRTNDYGSAQTPLRPVGGLGNEAVVGEVSGGGYSVTVIVRVNNLLLFVQYQNSAGPADEEIMRNALTAARWGVESLTRDH